jgi:hypothetical protein
LCLSTGNRRNQFGKEVALFSQRQFSLGAPDCLVRQAGSGELAALGFRRRRMAINHRTVWWCTGLSGEPMVGRANGRPRNPCVTRGRLNGLKGAPDCPVCTGQCPVRQRLQNANGRLRQNRKEIRTRLSGGHRTVSGAPTAPKRQRSAAPKQERNPHQTVRCARRQKARIAFLECSQRLLAALGL